MAHAAQTIVGVAQLKPVGPIIVVIMGPEQYAAPVFHFVALRDMLAYLHVEYACVCI